MQHGCTCLQCSCWRAADAFLEAHCSRHSQLRLCYYSWHFWALILDDIIFSTANHLRLMVQHAVTHSPLEEPQVVLGGWQTAERKVLGSDEGVAIVTAICIDTVAKAKGVAAASEQGFNFSLDWLLGLLGKWLPTGAGSWPAGDRCPQLLGLVSAKRHSCVLGPQGQNAGATLTQRSRTQAH